MWVRNLPHEGNKLDPLWTGPCEILSRVGNTGRYQIAMTDSIQDVYSERLKMYLPMVHGERIRLRYYKPQQNVPEDDALVVERSSNIDYEMKDISDVYAGKAMTSHWIVGSQQQALWCIYNKIG